MFEVKRMKRSLLFVAIGATIGALLFVSWREKDCHASDGIGLFVYVVAHPTGESGLDYMCFSAPPTLLTKYHHRFQLYVDVGRFWFTFPCRAGMNRCFGLEAWIDVSSSNMEGYSTYEPT